MRSPVTREIGSDHSAIFRQVRQDIGEGKPAKGRRMQTDQRRSAPLLSRLTEMDLAIWPITIAAGNHVKNIATANDNVKDTKVATTTGARVFHPASSNNSRRDRIAVAVTASSKHPLDRLSDASVA